MQASIRWLVALPLALAGCSSGSQKTVAVSTPVAEPTTLTSTAAAEAEDDLQDLLSRLVGGKLCDKVGGAFMPLRASGEGGGESEPPPIVGRLWVDGCDMSLDGPQISGDLSAMGWRFVDRTSKKLGADFEVDEYAKFAMQADMRARVNAGYAREEKIALLWLRPTQPLSVQVEPTTSMKVRTPGPWASLIGGAAWVAPGISLEGKAKKKLSKRVSKKTVKMLEPGVTVIADLCTGYSSMEAKLMAESEVDPSKWRGDGPVWVVDDEVRLHPRGLDIAGTVEPGEYAAVFEVEILEGPGIEAMLACQEEAAIAARAFAKGEEPPPLRPLDQRKIESGKATLRIQPDCPVVMVSRPLDGRTRFRVRANKPAKPPKGILDCAMSPPDEAQAKKR